MQFDSAWGFSLTLWQVNHHVCLPVIYMRAGSTSLTCAVLWQSELMRFERRTLARKPHIEAFLSECAAAISLVLHGSACSSSSVIKSCNTHRFNSASAMLTGIGGVSILWKAVRHVGRVRTAGPYSVQVAFAPQQALSRELCCPAVVNGNQG